MPSVLQPWVEELPMMQQTVLLECVRGADGLPKQHVSKFILRWYRRCILFSAMDKRIIDNPWDEGGGNFTGPIPHQYVSLEKLFSAYLGSHDEIPHHFHMHLVHGVEILGYKHPNTSIRARWAYFYVQCCRDLHLKPESKEELNFRLGDSRENWQAAGGEILDLGRE